MRNIAIVGAGIAGLTAGIYALQSGFDVTIYESHTIPGGASTSWRRKGYLFEGGMHWLTGSSPDIPLNRLWREVGALDDSVAVHYRDVFLTFEYEGQTARLYRDVERLHNHLIELSPEDGREISKLCCDLKKFAKLNMPVTDIKGLKTKKKSFMSLGTILRMLPALPKMPYYARQSAKEYGMRYKSELLQRLFEKIIGPDYSATALVFTLATLASGDGGYPEGGSLNMALRMAKKFDILGGKIRYGMRVNTVSVRNGIADGVVVDGELLQSDAVIVTRDTLSAIDDLFDFPIREPWTERMRKVTKPLLNTFICLGIEVDLEGLPERMDFVPMRPLMCGGKEEQVIKICNYAGYEGYAPKGCTAVTSAIIGDTYDYWKARKEDGTYEIEKEKLAKDFIKILSEKLPQTAEKTAVWDVATPLTYERYLGSFKGSWMTVATKEYKMEYYPSKPENIRNLYFAGQRLRAPGGLPVALDSGRKAVQFLCKDFGMVFGRSEKPPA